ncbi:YHYH protein [SAR202 cluster bacterium AC-647-N09_OGT_505m]|nr:YHYH protein [SAR202 cluster bacterium AC-647-N09_OGT_505m]
MWLGVLWCIEIKLRSLLLLVLTSAFLVLVAACGRGGQTVDIPTVVVNELDEAEQTPVIAQNTRIHSGIPQYMEGVWLCANSSAPFVDDLSTEQSEGYRCSVTVEYTDEFAVVKGNGIPNHDYESGLGCCAAEVEYEWKIPLEPELASYVTYAPERGAIAISVNGVPFFGPEEGPGGDAVALHFDYFVEDRQPIVLGLCGGHSAGTTFHYHFDGNCVHWHPEIEEKEWKNWNVAFLKKDEASPVIGFAFDGYPIYGPYGNDSDNILKEMNSSYRLREGENGYGGIDDWEYVEGLGDLDECNGITSEVPGMDGDLYHYHASKVSGSGEIGFPYFILCYSGVPETSNMNQGSQDPDGGMKNRMPGGNNAPRMGKPDCLPPKPPLGRDNYPADWSDLSPCQ